MGDTFLYGVEVRTVGDVLHRLGNGVAEFEQGLLLHLLYVVFFLTVNVRPRFLFPLYIPITNTVFHLK